MWDAGNHLFAYLDGDISLVSFFTDWYWFLVHTKETPESDGYYVVRLCLKPIEKQGTFKCFPQEVSIDTAELSESGQDLDSSAKTRWRLAGLREIPSSFNVKKAKQKRHTSFGESKVWNMSEFMRIGRIFTLVATLHGNL